MTKLLQTVAGWDGEIWGRISLSVLLLAFLWSLVVHPRLRVKALSALNCFTLGVFLAGALLFVPVYKGTGPWEDSLLGNGFYILCAAAVDSIQMFVLALEKDVVTALGDKLDWLGLYAAALSVLAPLLTFGNVMAFFGDITGALSLRLCMLRKVVLLSELSPRSMSIATEVHKNGGWIMPPMIVFANVTESGDDTEQQLMDQARQMGCICLKKEVSRLKLACVGRAVEIFLTGDDETVNIACAAELAGRYKNAKRCVTAYVYASSEYADHMLDTLDRGSVTLHHRFARWLRENPEEILTGSSWLQGSLPFESGFSIRRIDPVDLLVKEVLTMNGYADYKKITETAKEKGTVSVAILGMGCYGTHFLKTAVWFYQKYGWRVRFDVFDAGQENGDPESRLRQECPELLTKNRAPEADEAQYDIRFHKVDCFSGEFSRRLSKELQDTDLVFIAFGDDDLNIRMATTVRTLFDRMLLSQNRKPGERPFIYTVLYDDLKLSNLGPDCICAGLRDPLGKFSYDIRFVGTLATQYSYESIRKVRSREEKALRYHLDWARKEGQLRWYYALSDQAVADPREWTFIGSFRDALAAEAAQQETEIEWHDGGLVDPGNKDPEKRINREKLRKETELYMNFSYYRNSSMAKAEHKEALQAQGEEDINHFVLCDCRDCTARRITEHMRWNAYIRSLGFIAREKEGRDNRAKLHSDLKPWKDIPLRERYKD